MTSRSQLAVRAVLVAASAGVALLTLVEATSPLWPAALLLVAFAAFVARRPGSHLVGVLMAVLALHWLATVPVPSSTLDWLATAGAAGLLLLVHASAALAASLPAQAAVPGTSLRRWARRTALVVAASVPVWAVGATVTLGDLPGRATFTYAALAGAAVLALGVWLVLREQDA